MAPCHAGVGCLYVHACCAIVVACFIIEGISCCAQFLAGAGWFTGAAEPAHYLPGTDHANHQSSGLGLA